jgi:hypothetical protein
MRRASDAREYFWPGAVYPANEEKIVAKPNSKEPKFQI